MPTEELLSDQTEPENKDFNDSSGKDDTNGSPNNNQTTNLKAQPVESILSRPTLIVDLPEPKNLQSEYIYNFFTPSERLVSSETGNKQQSNSGIVGVSSNVGNQQDVSANTNVLNNSSLEKFYGKKGTYNNFIKLSFTPSDIPKETITRSRLIIEKSRGKFLRESSNSAFSRVGLNIVDTGSDITVYNSLKSTRKIQDAQIDSPSNLKDSGNYNNAVLRSLNKVVQAEGYNFSTLAGGNSPDATKILQNPASTALKGQQFGFSILPQVAGDIADSFLSNMKHIFVDEAASAIASLKSAQSSASGTDPNKIRIADFDFELPNIYDRELKSESKDLTNKLIGYVVKKFGFNSDGSVEIFPEKIIPNPTISTILDPDVAYGRRYRYRISCLYLCEFEAVIEVAGKADKNIKVGSLFESEGSDVIVDCYDLIAPPPPVDLKFKYRGDDNGLTLIWNFPVNLQNDICKFQVFRRKSVFEPFEMIREYNFDSSIIKTKSSEDLPEFLITRTSLPVTIHRDPEFTRDSKFIYAIAAVDAHGLTSNYSVQLEASYDRYRNRINTKLISQSGAPKPYPNLYIAQDTFVDTMRMSGYKRVNIFFDPEYVKVFESTSQTDLDHILFNNTSSGNNVYKLMVTNTDFQKSRTLDIKIVNKYLEAPITNASQSKVFINT